MVLLFPENSIKNILIKDSYKSQNMKCNSAVDCFKTENVDAETEIRKAEKRKDCHFLPEMLAISYRHSIIFCIFHNCMSNPCTENMWTSLK